MDPLFERRELSMKVHIHSKNLQRGMNTIILAQLKMNYEGRCFSEGYIQPNSITVVNYSLGRTNYIRGGVDYDVQFQADICMPHPGQRFKAPVTVRSKVGIHAEVSPIKIFIPRDLHLGNTDFDTVKVGEEIEFEVIGGDPKQKATEIIILGRLLSKVQEEVQKPLVIEPTIIQTETGDEEKKIVVTPTEVKPKTRKLKQGGSSTTNELPSSFEERMVEGPA